MAVCSPKLFGNNLECTRRVGYGGLYAEMIYNSRLLNNAAGFYEVELDGMKGLGQSQQWLHLQPGRTYEWHVVAGDDPAWVKTQHENYDYISVYNPAQAEEKLLSGVAGDYEILAADGVDFRITAGTGVLEKLPPLSVAFIKTVHKT